MGNFGHIFDNTWSLIRELRYGCTGPQHIRISSLGIEDLRIDRDFHLVWGLTQLLMGNPFMGQSLETIQCPGCVQNSVFSFKVVGFPIGLSLRIIQGFGSVQNLYFFFEVVGFPIGLSPRTTQGLGSVQNSVFFLLSSWFSHRLESEDHTRPWFCPKLSIFSFK